MVNIEEDTINKISDGSLEDFDKFLQEIPDKLNELPDLPSFSKKDIKKHEKQLKATYVQNRINKILGIKNAMERTLSEVEKEFIYKSSLKEKIMGRLFGKAYMNIYMVMPYGTIKQYKRGLKEGKIKVAGGTYLMDLRAVIKFNNRPSLFYFYDNPNPIIFDATNHSYMIDAKSIRFLLNANVVKDIFVGLTPMQMAGLTLGAIAIFVFGGILFFIIASDKFMLFLLLSKKWFTKK